MHTTSEFEKIIIFDPFFKGQKRDRSDALQEINDLCEICNFEICDSYSIFVRNRNNKFLVSKGIFEDFLERVYNSDVDIVVFSSNLTPSQINNIKSRLQKRVLVFDKSRLIIEVFIRRSKSASAKLQSKIALLKYERMNIRDAEASYSQQKHSMMARGIGESALELEKRRIKNDIKDAEDKLIELSSSFDVLSKRRKKQNVPSFTLFGYTNAGKSSILRSMSEDEGIYIDSKVFATLSTKTRSVKRNGKPEYLITDTIGFINDIPPFLVDAFKGTIKESLDSRFILFIVDISDDRFIEKFDYMVNTIKELGRDIDESIIFVFNKIDKVSKERRKEAEGLVDSFPSMSVFVSAKTKDGFDELYSRITEAVDSSMSSLNIKVPISKYSSLLRELSNGKGRITYQKYLDSENAYEISILFCKSILNNINILLDQ